MNFTEKWNKKENQKIKTQEKIQRMSQDDGEGSRMDICSKNNHLKKPNWELIHLTQMCLSKQGMFAASNLNISDALTWEKVMAEE